MANTGGLVKGFYTQQTNIYEEGTMTRAVATTIATLNDNHATCRHIRAHTKCNNNNKNENRNESKNKYCNFSKSICNIKNFFQKSKRSSSNNICKGNVESQSYSKNSIKNVSSSSGRNNCGNLSCTSSLSLFCCKYLNSPNSIITYIKTTTIYCCIRNICTCWWWLWWWSSQHQQEQQQEQQYKIKSKTLKQTATASLTTANSNSHSACISSSALAKQQHKKLATLDFCTSVKWYIFFWLLLSILAPCTSLSMTEVRIPKHIMRYETASLGCKYDLDGESLYSVKWYKDGFEFYRYVPRDKPPGQVFPLPGVDVDLQNSTDNVVVLNHVTLQSTGRYRCEVSGEAPSFQTVSGHEDMIVVVTPTKGPQITGGQPRYSIGEKVSVNCTSAPSKPICHLSWLINGVHANRSYLRYYEPKIVGREGLEVATLGLEFRVRG